LGKPSYLLEFSGYLPLMNELQKWIKVESPLSARKPAIGQNLDSVLPPESDASSDVVPLSSSEEFACRFTQLTKHLLLPLSSRSAVKMFARYRRKKKLSSPESRRIFEGAGESAAQWFFRFAAME
jgi:hypothetical protein